MSRRDYWTADNPGSIRGIRAAKDSEEAEQQRFAKLPCKCRANGCFMPHDQCECACPKGVHLRRAGRADGGSDG